MNRKLRPVGPGESPAVKKRPAYRKVSSASAKGDTLGELEAMRKRVAKQIDDESTPATGLAALVKLQVDLGKRIDEMKALEGETEVLTRDSGDGTDTVFRPEAI